MRTCKVCRIKFEPQFNSVQMCCSVKCSYEYAKNLREKKEKKEWNKEKKERKEALKTKQDYEKELQAVFNTFIRLRDKDKPCISCGVKLVGKYDAGHYYPTGSYKNLRFNEDNTHAQCVHCNQHKHGNLTEYSLSLPNRIGEEAFGRLISDRLIEKHYSIPELIELKVIYKEKIRRLKLP